MKISRINASVRLIVDGPLPGMYSIGRVQAFLKDQKIAMAEHVALQDPDAKEPAGGAIADLESKAETEMKSYEKTIQTAQAGKLFAKIAPLNEIIMRNWSATAPLEPRPQDQRGAGEL